MVSKWLRGSSLPGQLSLSPCWPQSWWLGDRWQQEMSWSRGSSGDDKSSDEISKGGKWWLSSCRTTCTGATASGTLNHPTGCFGSMILRPLLSQTFIGNKWLLNPAMHKPFPSKFVNAATLSYHCHLDICLQKKRRDLPLDVANLLQAYIYWIWKKDHCYFFCSWTANTDCRWQGNWVGNKRKTALTQS